MRSVFQLSFLGSEDCLIDAAKINLALIPKDTTKLTAVPQLVPQLGSAL